MAKSLSRDRRGARPTGQSPDYDADFHAWTQAQAKLLRERQLDRLDCDHLAEEIEDMGGRDRRELDSRLTVLVMHLLKWQFQAANRSQSWRATIFEQRREVAKLLEQSPSLERYVAPFLADGYRSAVLKASGETELSESAFPAILPYAPEQVLDLDYLPDGETAGPVGR